MTIKELLLKRKTNYSAMDPSFKNELKKKLDNNSYHVIVEKGTEQPFSGKYNMHFETGIYFCKACGAPLFDSAAKFDSGCGWPSFDQTISEKCVVGTFDDSYGMRRVEITCRECGGHLGHVFDDGPTQTGMRYCINSLSIDFDSEIESD